jgi:GTP 3',8-cyclase
MIKDQFGRTFKTLRISLTETCNFACTYCVKDNTTSLRAPDFSGTSSSKTLTSAEYLEIVRKIHRQVNFDTVRLTGGEPLLSRDINALVEGLKEMGIPRVKLTTNGFLLKSKALGLKNSGIDSINVSLDAIEESLFYKMTRRKNVAEVIEGIDHSIAIGISVKINSVIMKGVNEHQIIPLLHFAKERNILLRYLELMKMGHLHGSHAASFFSEREILDVIENISKVFPIERKTSSTANYWLTGEMQKFGIIANESSPFCHDCNRLRLDSYGNIYGCLSNNTPVPVMDSIDQKDALEEKLMQALKQKQHIRFAGSSLSMKQIGG